MGRLSDPRVAQYWDKKHLFAERLASRLKTDQGHPQPSCCNRHGIQWDEVAVYRQDTQWGDQLPRAAFLDGPIVHALGFANTVAELLSKATDSEPKSENSQPLSSSSILVALLRHPRLSQPVSWNSFSAGTQKKQGQYVKRPTLLSPIP